MDPAPLKLILDVIERVRRYGSSTQRCGCRGVPCTYHAGWHDALNVLEAEIDGYNT